MTDKRPKLDSTKSVPLRHPTDVNELPLDDRKRMLVIDESDLARRALVEFFRERDWHVASANAALVALDLALKQQPHVIVTELVLPDVEGYHFIRTLRAAIVDDVRVIAATSISETMFSRARGAGVDLVLPKPLDLGIVEALITDLVTR